MSRIKFHSLVAFLLLIALGFHSAVAQNGTETNQSLTAKQQSIVLISAFTAKGNLAKLKPALNAALDAGLTVNECKEVIVHLYAYCGFPRSIRGLQTLMTTLDERKAKGIKDTIGREASTIPNEKDKYETGWKNLAKLGGRPADGPIEKPTSGYGAFSPEIDQFLKEHLFADLFERDVLTYAEREVVTVSVLSVLGGVEPMLQSHIGLAMTQGLTESQLNQLLSLIESSVSKSDADAARKVYYEMIAARKSRNEK